MRRKPLRKLPESGNSQAEGCKVISYLRSCTAASARRNLIVGFAADNAVRNQRFERARQHGIRNIAYFTAQFAVPQDVFRRQHADVDTFKQAVESMFKGTAAVKGALVITPDKVIVTTPGAENKKAL